MSSGTVAFGQHFSPNLNTCEFFFWRFLMDRAYNSNAQMEELKENICTEIANVPAEQLQKVNQNLFCQCKERNM
jgi:hypothetical protein